MQAAKSLVSLGIGPELPEPLLLTVAISTEILYTGPNYVCSRQIRTTLKNVLFVMLLLDRLT